MNAITSLIEEVKQDAAGAAVLADWLGNGGVPVSQEQAEERANTCKSGYLGRMCPQNVEPGWWDRVKHHVADAIKKHIEIQNRAGLHVSNEEDLAMCKGCGCALRLKVWVPIKHVADHTTTQQLLSYPTFCWQRNELLKNTGDIT